MEIVEKRSWLARVHRICDENGWEDTATMAIFSTINGQVFHNTNACTCNKLEPNHNGHYYIRW
jgi:hypothetical protein